jgi:hypothetical protein
MSNIESVEDVFILMPIFKDSKKLAYYLGCIVNWGKRKGDKVEFSTNNGIVVKAISELIAILS